MNDLERRALLGDRQAQEECTRRGIVLACPFCGGSDGKTLFKFVHSDLYAHKRTGRCALDGMIIHNVADWNRRPAPPIGRYGECEHWADWGACGRPDNGWDAPPMEPNDFLHLL